LTRRDVLAYKDCLKEANLTPRTIANRLAFLKTFFRHFDLKWPQPKTDRVKYTEKTVEAYSVEDLKGLFEAANEDPSQVEARLRANHRLTGLYSSVTDSGP
jgi:site-specific recombinase XerD